MPVRALSLDLFDTLVDLYMERLPLVDIAGRRVPSTYGLLHAASLQWHALDFERFAAALGAVDRELRAALLAEHRELSTVLRFRALAERIGVADDAMADVLTGVHMAEIQKHVVHLAHHAELLGRLHRRVKLAVCSNFSHGPTARAVLADAGLLAHFDAVVISDDLAVRKPRAEIFQAVASRLELPPAEVLHVGDNLDADVSGADAAGMRTAWLTRRVRDPESALRGYAGARPGHTLADLAELERLL